MRKALLKPQPSLKDDWRVVQFLTTFCRHGHLSVHLLLYSFGPLPKYDAPCFNSLIYFVDFVFGLLLKDDSECFSMVNLAVSLGTPFSEYLVHLAWQDTPPP